jgi:NADPH:quinone reductase-like Zn-dependent oxidoreductase
MAQHSWAAGTPLELVELPTPVPHRREVRVRVQAIGVNPVDWKMRSHGPLRWAARLLGPRPPVIVGVDFAGVVDAVGPSVTDVAVGDRVAGGTNFARRQRGSYADTVLVRRDQICRVPESVDSTVAAALPIPGVTAWMSVIDLGRIRQVPVTERRVLVLGASGGVGQLVVQIAKREGALVCGVCSSANIDRVAGLGADMVIDYTRGDALAQARAHGPFSIVVDCAGGYAARRCRALLAPGGRHIMVAGDDAAALAARVLAPRRSKGILGRPTGARLAPLIDAVATGSLRVSISRTLPLTAAEEAHRLSRTGRMTGKLLLIPDTAPPQVSNGA